MSQGLFLAQNLPDISVPVASQNYKPGDASQSSSLGNIETAAGRKDLWCSRLSAFMLGSFGGSHNPANDQFAGTIGLSFSATPSTDIGVGFLGGTSHTDLEFDGESYLDSQGGILLASYQPDNSKFRIYGYISPRK